MSKITGLLRLIHRPTKLLKQFRKVEEVIPPPLRSSFYCYKSLAVGMIILLILVIAIKILIKKRLDCSTSDGSSLTASTQEKRSKRAEYLIHHAPTYQLLPLQHAYLRIYGHW
jgi:hypothetical protein